MFSSNEGEEKRRENAKGKGGLPGGKHMVSSLEEVPIADLRRYFVLLEKEDIYKLV